MYKHSHNHRKTQIDIIINHFQSHTHRAAETDRKPTHANTCICIYRDFMHTKTTH